MATIKVWKNGESVTIEESEKEQWLERGYSVDEVAEQAPEATTAETEDEDEEEEPAPTKSRRGRR